MQLYLQTRVEKFALDKWGSMEAIKEHQQGERSKREEKRAQKFVESVKDLRKRTRLSDGVLEMKSAPASKQAANLKAKPKKEWDYEEV